MALGPPISCADLCKIEKYLHLRCNKWDTQVGDVSVLSQQPLILNGREWELLCGIAERLAAEITSLESFVLRTRHDQPALGVPRAVWEALTSVEKLPSEGGEQRARSMRFDFHPTSSGWRVSEVNSDVPGGWGEGTFLPELYHPFYREFDCPSSPLDTWGNAIRSIAADSHIIFCIPQVIWKTNKLS